MNVRNFFRFILAILICQTAGFIGSIFTASSVNTWYADLAKPGFLPPNWLFAPAWIAIFTLMGASLYLVIIKGLGQKQVKAALMVFTAQLILNIVWSAIFFGLKNPTLAFYEILVLWFAIVLNIYYFYAVNKFAAYLLVPYLLWVSFAAGLNFIVWRLNF